MTRKSVNEFKLACKEFLETQGLGVLRVYGREIGVAEPTKKIKAKLIQDIVAILAFELAPIPRSNRGAPVKDSFVDPKVLEYIQGLCDQYPVEDNDSEEDIEDLKARMQDVKTHERVLTVEDPNAKVLEENGARKILKGQLTSLNGAPVLLPLRCNDTENEIFVSVDMIRHYDLREGDVITCYAEKRNGHLIATAILTINEFVAEYFHRGKFEEYSVCYPKKRIQFFNGNLQASFTGKFLEWLIPIGNGQRTLLLSAPKSGKSTLLLEMVKAMRKNNEKMKILVLLVDQSPENVGQFRNYLKEDELVYTTYEEEPDWQVFAADFLLQRAKRYAECGKDVCLIVDSFNALSRAYNDTQASAGGKVLAGGLESKTLQYLKRYFGTARCLERGGSITMLGALAIDTGNPVDELLKSELCAISNLQIYLSEELAKRRVYPSIDLLKTQGNRNDALFSVREQALDVFIRNEFLLKYDVEELLAVLSNASSFEDFEQRLYKRIKEKRK